MPYLDCHSLDTTIQSLADICDRSKAAVRDAIETYEPDWELSGEDPVRIGPREMLSRLGIELRSLRWDGTYYFHGTRTLDVDQFRTHGILPLGQVIDQLWARLYDLVRDELTVEEWREERRNLESGGGDHSGWLYRMKTADRVHHGPFSSLARDHHLLPVEGTHDYLAIPEIIEDIADVVGYDLQGKFEATAKSCIVKFRTEETDLCAIEAACWYVYGMIHGGKPGWHSMWGGNGQGKAVPSEAIVSIEMIER